MSPDLYPSALVLLLGLTGLLGWLLWRRRDKFSRPAPASPLNWPTRLKRGLGWVLRLIGFTLLVSLLLIGILLVYIDYQTVLSDLAPTPSQVEIPADLPFKVQEVTFTGGDQLTLAGWYLPPQNGVTLILLHGYGGNRLGMLWHAKILAEAGYGLLLYDERASGESAGQRRSFGWEDAPDVGGALEFLNRQTAAGQARVGILGCSIGGQIALQGAAYYPQIGAVWADGPAVIRAKDTSIDHWAGLLAYLSTQLIDQLYIFKGVPPAPALVDLIGKIEPRPVVLVAGGQPHPLFGPEAWHVRYFLKFSGPNTKLWVIPEATHCDGPSQRPEEYAQRLLEFFDQAFQVAR